MATEKDSDSSPATDGTNTDPPEKKGTIGGRSSTLTNLLNRRTGSSKPKGPPGGFDSTPLPKVPPGYTVKVTFHRASNLPLADINTLSSDPYILAQVYTDLPTRHKEDPPLQLRTKTIRARTDPVWETEWTIANIPSSGFRMKCRIFDEDPADRDDRLGNAYITVPHVDEDWEGVKEDALPIKKRMGSKRAYLLRAIAVCFRRAEHMHGFLHVSIELLGRTDDENGARAYTVGPQYSIKHVSPLLGRILGQKSPQEGLTADGKPKPQRYNFQANQMQLHGPVPEAMYHRYVEFKPFVKSMFTSKGIRGYLLAKALHHQHARVYNFDKSTEYDFFDEPSHEFTLKFLDLVHYDQGGRIFTYVLTLDSLFRFTETGKEFGIDMLSKHTMHSDVSTYIAFSGEFFIRRLKRHRRDKSGSSEHTPTHPPDDIEDGPPNEELRKDPSQYELIIDNDSGTYRPNPKLLPDLKSFMESNLPGLKVVTIDSQSDAEKMSKMKEEQRERKKKEGDQIVFTQVSRTSSFSSMSSSDIEELDRLEESGEYQERHFRHQMLREVGARADAAKLHMKEYKPSGMREGWKGSQKVKGSKTDLPEMQLGGAGGGEPSTGGSKDKSATAPM